MTTSLRLRACRASAALFALSALAPLLALSAAGCEQSAAGGGAESESESEGEPAGPGAGSGWSARLLDDNGDPGEYVSIAADAAGNVHVAYYVAGLQDLRYSVLGLIGDFTPPDTVDAQGFVGTYTSVAATAQGDPHVAYHDATETTLKYAWRESGGGWQSATVDGEQEGVVMGWHASLALAPDGGTAIAYHDASKRTLRVARRRAGGEWSTEVVDASGEAGRAASLAIAPDGALHVVHHAAGAGEIRRARRDADGVWRSDVIARGVGAGELCTAIAVGADGAAHVAFHHGADGTLVYARTTPTGTWQSEVVEDGGRYLSLALDDRGRPHLVYRDRAGTALRHAWRGDRWFPETVEGSASSPAGDHAALAIGPDGALHAAYRAGRTLRYAYRRN